jgi:hypothetical protein
MRSDSSQSAEAGWKRESPSSTNTLVKDYFKIAKTAKKTVAKIKGIFWVWK